jgi:adenylate cyclase
VRVKGRQQPVLLFEPLGLKANVSQHKADFAELCSRALDLYWRRDFEASLQAWLKIHQRFADDTVTQLFIRRCEHYVQQAPEPEWDGVWSHTSK